jgi:hypothetical protein
MIYYLNKSFGGFYRFIVLLNRKMPFYSLYPFLRNGCKVYLRSKNTPLLFKELNVKVLEDTEGAQANTADEGKPRCI